jgi:hypothetical protein
MINPFADVNWKPGLRERRKFAASMMVGFPSLSAIFTLFVRLTTHGWRPFTFWLGVIGLAIGVLIWLLPQIANPFYIVWYGLACCIGIVVANILFCAFYYFILTPIGLCLRTAGSKTFRKGFDKNRTTYWQDVTPITDVSRYYRQF